jgi:hypothetical protein
LLSLPKDELKHNQVTNHKIIMYHSKDSTKRPSSTSGQAPQSEEQMFRRDIADDTKSYTYEEWNTKFYAHLQPFLWKFCIIISVVLVLILVAVISASAQNKSAEDADFETIIGELFSLQDEDIDYSELYESLFQYYTQPINLNNTSPDVLRSLFVLSDRQIQNFFMHIQKNGRLLSIYELQAIPDFDLETINRLLPFVTVRETGTQADTRSIWKRILQEKNTFFLLRYSQTLEERKGYSIQEGDTTSSGDQKSRYLGTPFQTYLRFRTSHTKDFSIGFTLEKDQGEQFAWNSKNKQYGADFISAHAVLYNQGSFKALAVGDYKVQIGQGLILGGGFGLGKGSESINTIRRSTLGIRPYNSVVEGGFFRGAAATYAVGRFDITSFYSRLPQDANITSVGDTLSNEEDFINSIQITGLHRTPNEIQNRKQIKERALGGNVTYRSEDRNLELGATFVQTKYSTQLLRTPSKYNQYEFNGKDNFNAGTHFNYNWRNFDFFGEGAVSKSGGTGFLMGMLTSLSKDIQLSMLYRRYDRNFHTFYGTAFGESTRAINESGMYWGIKYKPNKRWILTAYYDSFRFPWLRFRTDAPSDGYEFLARLTHKPKRAISMYAQIRQEVKDLNWTSEDEKINKVIPFVRRQYQARIDFSAEKILFLRSRVQFSTFNHGGETTQGYLIAQDVNFDLGKVRLSTRFSLFQSDDFNNRQYLYEKDVLYVFSIPFFSGGPGFRNYYVLQLKPHKKIDIWVKYAFTKYKGDVKSIGSGLDEIQGNKRSDVRVQLRYKFK